MIKYASIPFVNWQQKFLAVEKKGLFSIMALEKFLIKQEEKKNALSGAEKEAWKAHDDVHQAVSRP